MKILGLSFDYHDAATAVGIDGCIVAAAQEERFSRIKHDAGIPRQAAAYCLSAAGLVPSDLDGVVYYEKPFLKFDRILSSSFRQLGRGGLTFLRRSVEHWLREGKFEVAGRIGNALGVPADKVRMVEHHQSHAASAFYSSSFDEATVVTLDGVGEYASTTISHGRGTQLRRLVRTNVPNSLGLFYSAFTAYLGFEVNEGEYKVMGMAGFGQPRHIEQLRQLFALRPDGDFRLDQRPFRLLCPDDLPYRALLEKWFGPARRPDAPFAVTGADDETATASRHYADIAASVQACTEEVILHIVDRAVARTGCRNVCLAGGVALNSLANGRLIRDKGYRLYVHPAAGDAGGAVGAAQYLYHHILGKPRVAPLISPYLGPCYGDTEIRRAIAEGGFSKVQELADEDELTACTADLLAAGKVVGWHQGRSEWGPRALGSRSILADPTRPDMQRRVNESIKFREPFRPFAPVVPVECARDYFDMPPVTDATCPEYYMLAVHPVRPEKRAILPAVTHVDGTARVQTVSHDSNPAYYALLRAFEQRSGVPVLLNTSYNLRGEPVVETPADALKTFVCSGLDIAILGRFVVEKDLIL